jgi:hypothetical protein
MQKAPFLLREQRGYPPARVAHRLRQPGTSWHWSSDYG